MKVKLGADSLTAFKEMMDKAVDQGKVTDARRDELNMMAKNVLVDGALDSSVCEVDLELPEVGDQNLSVNITEVDDQTLSVDMAAVFFERLGDGEHV